MHIVRSFEVDLSAHGEHEASEVGSETQPRVFLSLPVDFDQGREDVGYLLLETLDLEVVVAD